MRPGEDTENEACGLGLASLTLGKTVRIVLWSVTQDNNGSCVHGEH